MPPDDPRTWQEVAASNRERILALERESERTRDALHQVRGETAGTRYLTEKLAELAADTHQLTSRVEQLARHAVQRPSQSALAVLGQYIGLVVAIVALVVASKR